MISRSQRRARRQTTVDLIHTEPERRHVIAIDEVLTRTGSTGAAAAVGMGIFADGRTL